MEDLSYKVEARRYDKEDANFFYDYIALLGTMQSGLEESTLVCVCARNQHFFSPKQNQMMISWLKEPSR